MEERQEVIDYARYILNSYFGEGQVEPLISAFADDIIWNGAGKAQKAEGKEAVAKWFRDGQGEAIHCRMENEEYEYVKLGEDSYVCTGISDLYSKPGQGQYIQMHQRCTFVFTRIDGKLKIRHIHNSIPLSVLKDDELFADEYARSQYEELQARFREEQQKNLRDREILQLTTRNTPIGDYSYDPVTRTVEFPDYLGRRYGWELSYTNMPESFADANVGDESREAFLEMYRTIQEGGDEASCDFYAKNSGRWIRTTLSHVKDEEAGRDFIVGIVDDITLVKRAQSEYARITTALSNLYTEIYYCDGKADSYQTVKETTEDGTFSKNAGSYTKEICRCRKELVAEDFGEAFYDKFCLKNVLESLSEEQRGIGMDYKRKVPDGSYHWYRGQAVIVDSDEDGQPWHFIITARDIHEERSREEALSEKLIETNAELRRTLKNERQYRQAIMAEALVSFQINVTKGILEHEISRQGQSRNFDILDELGLMPPCSFYTASRRVGEMVDPGTKEAYINTVDCFALLKAFSEGRREVNEEYKLKIGDKEVYTRASVLLTQDEQTRDVLGLYVVKDITQLRADEEKTKEALQEAYLAANRANQAKSDFLSQMSHDIRTPMNAIIGMTAIAGAHLGDSERVEDCLKKITMSSKHLLALINEVLDMSKIESGKASLTEDEFNLSDVIEGLLSIVHQDIKKKHHKLSVKIGKMEHEKVIGDSFRLQQVLVNIVSNAIKYTPEEGRITLEIAERPTNRARVGCYEFICQDNGIGMKQEFIERIFEPFARADDEQVHLTQGTGLGMPIARNVVRMMGGDIKVESVYGSGSRFTVTIYLKLQEDENLRCEELVTLPILIADDEREICESTSILLNGLGMKSEWVLSGREAVEKVTAAHGRGEDYFAVILDWKMPEMDGVETARRIRLTVGPDIPIIVLSAYDWSDIENEARAAGVTAFISKPLFKSKLVQLLKGLLNIEKPGKLTPMKELEKKDFSGKRALLAEDNELNREIAMEILGNTGLAIDAVCDGQEAVDMVAASGENYYDIIFMDIRMPGMDGYQASREIRAMDRKDVKKIPIIAMTADAFAQDVEKARNAGMNQHIAKPLDLELLGKVLNRWLG